MEHQIDLQGKTDQQSFEQLLALFETLGSKDAVVATLGHHGEGVVNLLQGQIWGAFEWCPLHFGPPSWQYVLTRTLTKLPKRSIGEFLGADHQRCDALFIKLEEASQTDNIAKATVLFNQFRTGMEHHFAMEENVFFPAFEQATGMTQGPTMVMRMEHRQMRGLIGQGGQALAQGKLDGVSKAGSTLMILMRQHNIKEEQMLYPMADQHLGNNVDTLVRNMQKLSSVEKMAQ
ncbi:MAG: hemerythrin domain-containing protein [Magnetococcus sp. THC-1_WYH]